MAGISPLQHTLSQAPGLPVPVRWKFRNPELYAFEHWGGLFLDWITPFGKDTAIVYIHLCGRSRELLLSCGIACELNTGIILEFADNDAAYKYFRFITCRVLEIEAGFHVGDRRLAHYPWLKYELETLADPKQMKKMGSRPLFVQKDYAALDVFEKTYQKNKGGQKCSTGFFD